MIKYSGSLYVTDNKERTIAFYKELFGLRVISDFNSNFTFTGGISFQTRESWKDFIEKENQDIIYHGNDHELYFETDDLDGFIKSLELRNDIQFVHSLKTHEWGQRGIRIYDPDFHIIEISETLSQVCIRFVNEGMSVADISQKTMLSEKIIQRFLSK